MKSLFLMLIILFSVSSFAQRGKTFVLEPEIGLRYDKWSQDIESSSYEGQLGGNNMGYRYGANFHWIYKRLSLGYGWKQDKLNWGYVKTSADGDNDWRESTPATEASHTAFLGLKFKQKLFILQYIFSSKLSFSSYYNKDYDSADMYGKGFGLKMQMPLGRRLFWGVTLRQVKYTEGKIGGEKHNFGSATNGTEFSNKTIQTIMIDISWPIGIF